MQLNLPLSIHQVYCTTSEGCNKGQICASAGFCKTLFGKIKTNYKATKVDSIPIQYTIISFL